MNKRFNINKNIEKLYVEIPKALIYEPKYRKQENSKGLSNEAKLLYGILLDKTYLSIFKAREDGNTKFIDENGDAFIYFDNASIEYVLQVSNKKAIQIKKELVSFNLLEEVQQGLGKANRLYLNTVEIEHEKLIQYVDNISSASKATNNVRKLKLKKWREEQSVMKCKNYTTVENTNVQEVETAQTIENALKCKNYTTEMYNLHISNTDFSNTDLKSVVVINGVEKKITEEYKIQLDKNKTVSEKINDLQNITFMNESTKALIHKFIEYNILVSKAQIKMLNECVYDVAIKALDETIAKTGQTFSYFYEVYKSREKEDIDNFVNDFMPISKIDSEKEHTNDFIFMPSFESKEDVIEQETNLYNSFNSHMYNKCVEFGWDMNTITVRVAHKKAIEYAKANNLEYPKNLI